MHERAPVGMEAAKLIAQLTETSAPPSVVKVAIAADVKVDIARDAWDAAADGTILEGVHIEWVLRTATLACLACGHNYSGDKLAQCPKCGGDGLIVKEPPIAEVVAWSPATS
ncbi:MAG: hydrogenase/urease maturation nickel metallochaperone HypA [Actinomycetia bacterium]|nr:hydrogenase/urease maturation nickel metallochaperone HypA [Actinomycetes bacterium]